MDCTSGSQPGSASGDAPTRREDEIEDEPLACRRRTGEERPAPSRAVPALRQPARRAARARPKLKRTRITCRVCEMTRDSRRDRRGERPSPARSERRLRSRADTRAVRSRRSRHRLRPAPGHGRAVALTATEYELLRILSVNAGRVVTTDSPLRQGWSPRNAGDAKSVGAFVMKLRSKLGDDAASPIYAIQRARTSATAWQSRARRDGSRPPVTRPSRRCAGLRRWSVESPPSTRAPKRWKVSPPRLVRAGIDSHAFFVVSRASDRYRCLTPA